MSRTRQWYYDGIAIPGATGRTVVIGAGQLDSSKWECRTQVDYGADSVAALAGISGGGAFSHAFSGAFDGGLNGGAFSAAFSGAFDGGIPPGGEFSSAFNSAFNIAA